MIWGTGLLRRAILHTLQWYERRTVLHELGHGDIHDLLRRAILHAFLRYKMRPIHNRLPDLGHWHGPDLLSHKTFHVTLQSLRHQHTPDLLHDSFQATNSTRKPVQSCRGNNAARRRSNVAARRVLLRIVVVAEPTSITQAVRTSPTAEAPGHTCWAARVASNQTPGG